MFWWIIGCVVGGPERLVEPDAARVGAPGERGPFGVDVRRMAAPARVSEVVPVDVVYPVADPPVTDAPVVVLIHGGLVPPERYRWLGVHFATRGYVTLLPRAELDLAIAQPGNGDVALTALRRQAEADGPLADLVADDGRVAVGGHSLGGVMAARQWTRDAEIDLVFLLASFPANGDPVEDQGDRPVVAVSGTTDALLGPDEFVERTADRFVDPQAWLISGLNHFGWTDDPTDGERGRDGALEGDLDALRTAALTVLDRALDVHLRGAVLDVAEPVDGAERVLP